jgi:3-phosphoshikimate 1-carboxyvinyltransferase
MTAAVIPTITGPVNASVVVPGSKSITNRALLCAALADGQSILHGASDSMDTAMLVNGLNLFGVLARPSDNGLVVEGNGGRLFPPRFPIPVGNAGTTFRFLVSLAALLKGTTRFELSPRMAERPLDDLTDALRQVAVTVTRDVSGLYVSVEGSGISGGTVHVRGDRSSQFLSSLLLASPYAAGPMQLVVDGHLSSAPYVRMTLDVMKAFGVGVANDGVRAFTVSSPTRYVQSEYRVEADASSATYPFAAAAIAGGCVNVAGVSRQSQQADVGFLAVLERMGCGVHNDDQGIFVERQGALTGVEVDMNAMPDAVPTLVAASLFASGETRILNVGHLRYKESNRIETLANELGKLGARVSVVDDGLVIHPVPLHGAAVSPHDDHRLAMSFALIGMRVPGVVVEQPECVSKSFPRFWEEFGRLIGTPIILQ